MKHYSTCTKHLLLTPSILATCGITTEKYQLIKMRFPLTKINAGEKFVKL